MKATQIGIMLLACVLAGCLSFRDQVPDTEPHGMLRIKADAGDPDFCRQIKTIDGAKVRTWRRDEGYRVSPGQHVVVFSDIRTEMKAYPATATFTIFGSPAPFDHGGPDLTIDRDGSVSVSGSPGTMMGGPVPLRSLRMPQRVCTDVPFLVEVEAGYLYELDGYSVKKVRLEGAALARPGD